MGKPYTNTSRRTGGPAADALGPSSGHLLAEGQGAYKFYGDRRVRRSLGPTQLSPSVPTSAWTSAEAPTSKSAAFHRVVDIRSSLQIVDSSLHQQYLLFQIVSCFSIKIVAAFLSRSNSYRTRKMHFQIQTIFSLHWEAIATVLKCVIIRTR